MMQFLIAAILFGAAWIYWGKPRGASAKARPASDAQRSYAETEARVLLGVSETAGTEEIRAAHRRLIALVHPDKGGSPELTRRINAARDLLLK